jgi:glycosyltransferase involved in cell wall biosynthesis
MVKKKIAVIGLKGLPAFGGASRSFESIIDFLKDKYDITVYSVNSHTDKNGLYNGYKQIVFKKHKKKVINTFIYLWKSTLHCLFKEDYDLIHVHHAQSGFIIPFLKIKYRVITTLHGVYNTEKFDSRFGVLGNLFFRFFEIINFKYSDYLVSVCKHDLKFINKYTKKKVYYIPNGIYLNQKCSNQPIKYKDYILFAAGKIYYTKGCHLFLKALKKIEYTGKILIVGDLDQVQEYKHNILKISDGLNIEFLGLIYDKSLLMSYIKNSMLFIFPSLHEAMSNMFLETASMKCPIICSDIPANKEIFDDTEVTFFKTENVDDLADKIIWTINNKNVIIEKAEKAYRKLEKEYKWKDIAIKYEKLYQEIIK